MKWFGYLSRRKPHTGASPLAEPSAPLPVGIDYLLAQSGRTTQIEANPASLEHVSEQPTWEKLLQMAELVQQREAWAEAVSHWQRMRTAFPDIFHSYTGEAVALCGLEQFDDARLLLAKAAERFPEERAVPLEQGRLAMRSLDWTAAEVYWRTALTFDVRPWWVYTELAGALEHQGRLNEADEVLLDARSYSDEPDEITLFIYPARLAWKRQQWTLAVARWTDARNRFPDHDELPAKQYEALMRLWEHDPIGYDSALRELGMEVLGKDKRELVLRFESLGGTGPEGGCEFGCFQRQYGAEPLGLFRWATVSPEHLIACLKNRFVGMGHEDAIAISQHEGQWEIRDTAFGTSMHSFVSTTETPHDRMIIMAGKRMRYLRDKLIADLEGPTKIFVLKIGWRYLTTAELDALSQGIRSFGRGELLCVCAADNGHPAGFIEAVAPGVFVGFVDLSFRAGSPVRYKAWEELCGAMLTLSTLSHSVANADRQQSVRDPSYPELRADG